MHGKSFCAASRRRLTYRRGLPRLGTLLRSSRVAYQYEKADAQGGQRKSGGGNDIIISRYVEPRECAEAREASSKQRQSLTIPASSCMFQVSLGSSDQALRCAPACRQAGAFHYFHVTLTQERTFRGCQTPQESLGQETGNRRRY